LAAGHLLARDLSFPPDTHYCRTVLGISCYQPSQFQQAYDLNPLYKQGLTGAGRTIVLVDAFGSPTIANDLRTFDANYGLPDPPAFTILQPAGAVPAYPEDPFGASDRFGWAIETTLDVEWSHVIAPGANIVLVETPVSETEGLQGFPEIMAAENYVVDHGLGDVISQSFGATEQTFTNPSQIVGLRGAFKNAHDHKVTVLASSGDQGAAAVASADGTCCLPYPAVIWPASDPLVTALGGTQLHLADTSGLRLSADNVWNDSDMALGGNDPFTCCAGGGGVSSVFDRPDFQNRVGSVVGNARGIPDISMSAAVDGGVVFYYTVLPGVTTTKPHWGIVGGTSEASPLFAGVVAIADQIKGDRIGYLNPKLYRMGDDSVPGIVDVTQGNNTYVFADAGGNPQTVPGYTAASGYDLASGWGTIDAASFTRALAGPWASW
jgi:subtilase family serine protease